MLWNSYPRDVVHEFWGRFPPQHPLISDGFGLLFFFLWMMSTFGNGLVIYIFLSTKTLRTAVSNNQILNPMIISTLSESNVKITVSEQHFHCESGLLRLDDDDHASLASWDQCVCKRLLDLELFRLQTLCLSRRNFRWFAWILKQ